MKLYYPAIAWQACYFQTNLHEEISEEPQHITNKIPEMVKTIRSIHFFLNKTIYIVACDAIFRPSRTMF